MVSFAQFFETCVAELVDEANTVELITGQLNGLKAKYEKSPIWKNKALEQIFAHYDHSIKAEADSIGKQMVFYDFKEECKRLDKYLNTLKGKNKSERNKLQKKVKDLQTRIKKDLRKIDRLDQSEISIDDLDNENSDHMKKYKYEQRVKRFSNQLLRLQGAKESTRLLDKVFKYTGTPYKELNESISAKYRAIMQKKYKGKIPQRPVNSTPNIIDITEIIENFCSEKKVKIPNPSDLAFNIANDIIKEVQSRREMELFEMMNDYEHDSHLRPTTVVDLADEELNKRLISNEELCRDSLIKKRKELEEKLDKAGTGDIGGEDGTASEEEDDDDDDDAMEDGIDDDDDDDEEISEDEATEGGDANPDEDDEDDDPILLDEPATVLNGDAPGSSANENKKRPIETNGTETNGEEPSKKAKVIESQEKVESNSAEKSETSTNGEENSDIEMKEKENLKVSDQITKDNLADLKSNEDQSAVTSSESKEKPKEENTKKISEESTINPIKSDSKQSTSSPPPPSVVKSPSKSATTDSEVKTDSNQSKDKSESDDCIKIVDLEDENPKDSGDNVNNDDEDDDDDVICLD